MATTYKRLGAIATSGVIGTADTLYTASNTAATSTISSTIIVSNTSGTTQTFSLATSATTSFVTAGYIAKEATLGPNEFYAFTIGLTLDPACRYLLVSGSSTAVVASAFGVENT